MTYGQYCRLNVRVTANNRSVIRKARTMLSEVGMSRARRDERHAWLRAILYHHDKAFALYAYTELRAREHTVTVGAGS